MVVSFIKEISFDIREIHSVSYSYFFQNNSRESLRIAAMQHRRNAIPRVFINFTGISLARKWQDVNKSAHRIELQRLKTTVADRISLSIQCARYGTPYLLSSRHRASSTSEYTTKTHPRIRSSASRGLLREIERGCIQSGKTRLLQL